MSPCSSNGDQQSVFSVGLWRQDVSSQLDLDRQGFFVVNDLSLKITQFDGVIVDQRQSAHAGRCEVERRG